VSASANVTVSANGSDATSRPGGTASLRDVLALARPYWRLLATAVVCILGGALLELAPPLVVKQLIDVNLTQGEREGLLWLGLIYFAATAVLQGTTFLTSYLTALAAQGILHDLRVRLFAHLQRLPLAYYDRTPIGDAISRCTADIETVNVLFTSGVATLVTELVRLITIAVTMLMLSGRLSLLVVFVVPVLVVVTRFLQVRVRNAERATRQAIGELNSHLQENLAGWEVVRSFGREAYFVQRFRRTLRRTLAASNRSWGFAAVYPPLMNILAAIATAWLLWVGTGGVGGLLANWGVSLGTLTAFVLLLQRFFRPINALGEQWQQVQSALSGAERVFAVLALPPDLEPPGARSSGGNGSLVRDDGTPIRFRDVVFGYLPEHPVLREVSLHVAAGEHVALVGRTGAGKTSALYLLAGLYAPWSGTVRAAGLDPRFLAEEERRRVVGVVPQTVHLFTGTVRENLTLFDSDVSLATIRRAAALTGAAGFVESLPRGYDTVLSGARGDGVQLSAGQRQLLALTRAFVWEPRVLLLDEATASIDGASDAAFRAALRRTMLEQGGAVLTVAHRLSTAREADRVLVLDGGRVVEDGTPGNLIARGGRFAELVALEEAGLDWEHATLPPVDGKGLSC
jgi:ATP-binding cassette, subfamily B, multidrug efflux pump